MKEIEGIRFKFDKNHVQQDVIDILKRCNEEEKRMRKVAKELQKFEISNVDNGTEITCFDCENNQGAFCPLADMYLSVRPRFCEAFTPRSQRLVVSIATVAKARRVEKKRCRNG